MSERPLVPAGTHTAGFFSRLEAFIVDLVLLSIAGALAGWVVGLIFNFFKLDRILATIFPGLTNTSQRLAALVSPVIALVTIAYFVFFWTLTGFTPGKALLGLQIVRRDGKRLSIGRSLLRFICYWVSAIPLFLGFIWVLLDRRREGWHDKIADTHVIYAWKKHRKSVF